MIELIKKTISLVFVFVLLLSAFLRARAEGSHDVAVVSVTTSCLKAGLAVCTEAYSYWTIDVNVVVRNEGDFSETFNVTAYYENATGTYTIGTQNVTLATGENTTLTFPWSPPELDDWDCGPIWLPYWWLHPAYYDISANASVVSGEINTEDNIYIDGTFKVRILCDASGDNHVDVTDFTILGMNWMLPVPPAYPFADFNFDLKVDVTDFSMLGWNYYRV